MKGIDTRREAMLRQAEALGEQGSVQESQELMKVVDALHIEREQVRAELEVLRRPMEAARSMQRRPEEVCTVCCAVLAVDETQVRVEAHLQGKMHIGFDLIRKYLADARVRLPRAPRGDRAPCAADGCAPRRRRRRATSVPAAAALCRREWAPGPPTTVTARSNNDRCRQQQQRRARRTSRP